ncbi:hypothetical protein QBC46DRAFT_452257 [Diplogelasinospora grovesii]|uniref:Uncharacterized protein n=1 Tax=Diplogelasinospora grovesii TaxID=303347 RepID=A0AAN6S1J9_9PEZI|nr:hypothetical protein QBC46DRAFT_452257 [Diplogelasinospora grovesii]
MAGTCGIDFTTPDPAGKMGVGLEAVRKKVFQTQLLTKTSRWSLQRQNCSRVEMICFLAADAIFLIELRAASLLSRSFFDTMEQPQPSAPFSRPLRSVKSGASLLPSPGPLESMLKTTTETGDIGIFSIKPTRPSARPPGNFRPRSKSNDPSFFRPPTSCKNKTPHLRDDRRRLPSYRDTASEIISMYGQESRGSGSTSFTPLFDDTGSRSYSMTSCSSRSFSNQKAGGTYQSLSNGSLTQRPRSPFPYPTRLKRPGVRPSSPALTENGSVDYSRMVEIARVSQTQRTVHGSYKPTYPQSGRRPTPRLMHPDANRYMPCQPGYNAMPGPQFHPRHGSRSPAMARDRYYDWFEGGASDYGSRTGSLTSIVNMYQPPASAPPYQNYSRCNQSAGPLYYDYSEDFDNMPEKVRMPCSPLAPIPTRGPSLHRPMVLDDSCDDRLQVRSETGDASQSSNTARELEETDCETSSAFPEAEGPSTHAPTDNDGKLEEAVERQPPSTGKMETKGGNGTNVEMTVPIEAGDSNLLSSKSSEQPAELEGREKLALYNDQDAPTRAEPHGSSTSLGFPVVANGRDIDGQSHHHHLGVSQLRPNSQPVDARRLNSPSSSKKGSIPSASSDYLRRSKYYSIEPGLADLAPFVQHLDRATHSSFMSDIGSPCVPPQPGLPKRDQENCPISPGDTKGRGHRRNCAAVGFDINQLSKPVLSDILPPQLDRTKTPMLAPQPISPARELRVQNSIPKLMKALPPVPGDPSGSGICLAGLSTAEFDMAPQLSSFKASRLVAPAPGPCNTVEQIGCHEVKANSMSEESHPPCSIPSYNQVRTVQSGEPYNEEKIIQSENGSLKLQESGNTFYGGPGSGMEEMTMAPFPSLRDYPLQKTQSGGLKSHPPVTALPKRQGEPGLSALPGSPKKPKMSVDQIRPNDPCSSYAADKVADVPPARRLKKRLSNLRARLAESRMRPTDPSTPKDGTKEHIGSASAVTCTSSTAETNGNLGLSPSAASSDNAPKAQPKRLRGRVCCFIDDVGRRFGIPELRGIWSARRPKRISFPLVLDLAQFYATLLHHCNVGSEAWKFVTLLEELLRSLLDKDICIIIKTLTQ